MEHGMCAHRKWTEFAINCRFCIESIEWSSWNQIRMFVCHQYDRLTFFACRWCKPFDCHWWLLSHVRRVLRLHVQTTRYYIYIYSKTEQHTTQSRANSNTGYGYYVHFSFGCIYLYSVCVYELQRVVLNITRFIHSRKLVDIHLDA